MRGAFRTRVAAGFTRYRAEDQKTWQL